MVNVAPDRLIGDETRTVGRVIEAGAARPTGDVFTRPRPAAAVAALLGRMAVRFLVSRLTPGFPRPQDLAKVSRPRAPLLTWPRTYSPARSNSHFKTLP